MTLHEGAWCVGIAEIAERLGVPRQTVAQWHLRKKLPAPDARLAMGPVWREETVTAWISEHMHKTGNPR